MRTAIAGLAVLVIGGMVLVLYGDSGTIGTLQPSDFAQIVAGVALLIWLLGSAYDRQTRFTQVLRNIAIWLSVAFVLVLGYTYRMELQTVGHRVFGELVPTSPTVSGDGGDVTIRRDVSGHFSVTGEINGAEIDLLVDTGASRVSLTPRDAERAGIAVSKLRYTLTVSTANGTTLMAGTRLDAVRIGGIVARDVPAFVAQEGALSGSLLGVSFLDRLPGYSVRGDTLVLEAPR